VSAERLRETVLATLERIKEGFTMAVDGIDQLIQLHKEGATSVTITEEELSALPWIQHKSGDAEWTFSKPREDDPEDIKVLRAKLADHLNAKGKGPRKAVFIGKWRISFSGDDNQFFRRSPVKR